MTVRGSLPIVLRAVALVVALAAVVDPAFRVKEPVLPTIDLQVLTGDQAPADHATARAAVDRLGRSMRKKVLFGSDAAPAARVLVGDVSRISPSTVDDVPVSTIAVSNRSQPNVRIVSAENPTRVPLGWSARFAATVEAAGMSGRTSVLVLEQQGVELARAEHLWRGEHDRAQMQLFYASPATGALRISLRLLPMDGETSTLDNVVDLRLATIARRLKVLVHEPRPSWAAAFIRRTLEQNASFDVASLTRASRGLAVRAGEPPPRLTAVALEPFDLVIVGAPEELGASDVDALRGFARTRGGAVVLVPDRRPSGPYLDLLPVAGFDEALVENPLQLESAEPGPLRASELAIPRETASGRVIASISRKDAIHPVVVEWMAGDGRVIFAGALDAWRFREGASDGFARFWEALAAASISSPRKIEVSLDPPIARPRELVTVRARVRRTELDETATRTRTPPIRARIIGADGAETIVRLWPTAETGVFEGRVPAPSAGQYDVQVDSGDTTADEVLIAAVDVRHAAGDAHAPSDAARAITAATGGVALEASDLAPLERLLESLPRGEAIRSIHLARSLWFVALFVGLLCAEWALRRRHGLR